MSTKEAENAKEKKKMERDPSPAIKSRAVVKYVSVQCPVGYARLQCNTDLNLPPSNYLSSTIDTYGLSQILSQSTGFASFRMAQMFPDCVGEVDVVSGAECIKSLLKLPYHPNGSISMMVHRIENTLLLDEFDIYKYLVKSEWSWMKNFFFENILKTVSEKEKMLHIQSPANYALQSSNLMSKFLCHSLIPAPPSVKVEADTLEQTARASLEGPSLPEPDIGSDQNIPNERYQEDHIYNRNVVWTFEDIQMLIGSDLPIFGGADRPCVSLRLRDASEPINVLTGIDYWLDNLMCNVPEVIMCYHLDGIVQRYEPIKTEDIPHLEGSKFSPKVIKNVAQNILSFLKSNATKAGHTYWLFKGSNDDVVKLYDLTSLSGGISDPDGKGNPFTVPVGMLLYRVAKSTVLSHRTNNVKVLLENSLKLLPADRHPQIVASSHYMLADLYVPATTNPAAPDFKEESYEESDMEDDSCDFPEDTSGPPTDSRQLALMTGLALHDIGESSDSHCKAEKNKAKAKCRQNSSLGTEPPERCGKALQHALKGLIALHHITLDKCKEEERKKMSEKKKVEEQNLKMANPYQPIKMTYEPLHDNHKLKTNDHEKLEPHGKGRRKRHNKKHDTKSGKNALEHNERSDLVIRRDKTIPNWSEPGRDDDYAWKMHLKTLLYEKACLAYATLAEFSYSIEQYGFSLKYIAAAQRCQHVLSKMIYHSKVVDESCLLGRAGDSLFQFAKNWSRFENVFRVQYLTNHEVDRMLKIEMKKELYGDDEPEDNEFDIRLPYTIEEAMVLSCEKYSAAIDLSEPGQRAELLRRIASVKNELGVKYMHTAQEEFLKSYNDANSNDCSNTEKIATPLYETLSKKSFSCLSEATKIFEQVRDMPNLALLHCNMGRYMRFKAHCNVAAYSVEQRKLYGQATDHYMSAFTCLERRDACPDVWDLVCWELSSALFTRACIMQDHPPDSPKAATEVADALKQALKHCLLTSGARQCLYQFRAAMIYHRLGSFYHKQYREAPEEGNRRKSIAALTKSNYEQSVKLFLLLEETAMFLTVQLERVALQENLAINTPSIRLKSLQSALDMLRECEAIIKIISERDLESENAPEKLTEEISTGNVEIPTEEFATKNLENTNQTTKEVATGNIYNTEKLTEQSATGNAENTEKLTKEIDSMKTETMRKDIASSEVSTNDANEVEFGYLCLFEQRLQAILKGLIQYCLSRQNKDYEKLVKLYKTYYSLTLRIGKYEIKDFKKYSRCLYDLLRNMAEISEYQ